jgi:dystonin
LENLAKELDGIILSRFPQEKSEVEVILETINDFIKRLGFFDNDLKNLKETFMTIPMKTTGQKKNLDRLNELLKELDTQANLHRDRIVSLKDILVDYESNCIIAKDLENVLFSHFIMPSTLEGLRDLLKQLTSMQEVSIETQPALHRMNTTASQLGRMGVPTKSIDDLKILNTKLDKLNSRWNTLNLQLSDR